MATALIGHTGFVGGNIASQYAFDLCFNSTNIQEIENQNFDLLVIAAPSAAKWKANQEPEIDWGVMLSLMKILKRVQAKQTVYLSTVDVYKSPINVNEDTEIRPEENQPYGKHRFLLEKFIRQHFSDHLIVRLPGLFGQGLKKNLIFDLLNDNCLDLTHKESVFQFYSLENIWRDIEKALAEKIHLINFATEPTSAQEIARLCFDKDFETITEKPPVSYDMRSKYAPIYNGKNGYLYNKNQIIEQLRRFVENYAK